MGCPTTLPGASSVCSGRGNCTFSGECECFEPSIWTGEGDLVYGRPSCAINLPAVRALHVLFFLVALRTFVTSFVYKRERERLLNKTRNQAISMHDANVNLLCMICSLGFAAYAGYRAVLPRAATGTDVAGTVLFMFGAATYNLALILFCYRIFTLGFILAGLENDAEARVHSRRIVIFVIISLVFLMLNALSVALLLVFNNEESFKALVPFQLASHAGYMTYQSYSYVTDFKRVPEIIRRRAAERASEGPLRVTLDQIDSLRTNAIAACLFLDTIVIMFAIWRDLRQVAYPYVFPVIFTLSINMYNDLARLLRNTLHADAGIQTNEDQSSCSCFGKSRNRTAAVRDVVKDEPSKFSTVVPTAQVDVETVIRSTNLPLSAGGIMPE